jgi:hypothetical protein
MIWSSEERTRSGSINSRQSNAIAEMEETRKVYDTFSYMRLKSAIVAAENQIFKRSADGCPLLELSEGVNL